ncbi:sulfatase-like hydrolase/transferase [Rhodopirellula sp. JC639]|uniref:sulfatase-like hydrolase/transferase n=1 Tax=Stieleria mannarensis TaxID=2755585 RepID=UPI002570CCA7|nr:sulfatase-like hydrolase/transferase [Rhodopirellula sp. JC639]
MTDDHRWDSYGSSSHQRIRTPNLDRIAENGTRFDNAFVTLAICSPSRAACLTGRYGSANGVTAFGKVSLNQGETTFAHALRGAGYAIGVTGKWHLKTTPQQCGFDFASTCWSNGPWYNRKFTIDGVTESMPGFVDDVAADESIRFIRESTSAGKPFVLWMCTQVPHMDHNHTWPAEQEYLDRHRVDAMPLPETWDDDLDGKPDYLQSARNRTQALKYGYDDPEKIRSHIRDYRASVEQMDAAVGRVLDELQRGARSENTWIIFMGDNGWLLGEHGLTSKVLAYEESMRVPMAIAGPSTVPQVSDRIVLNIDLTATIYELAGLDVPAEVHGRSLLPIVTGKQLDDWRTSFLYEAPTPQLGSQPLWAVREQRWKYIETRVDDESTFEELYDLSSDAIERNNVAGNAENSAVLKRLKHELAKEKRRIRKEARRSTEQSFTTASDSSKKPPQKQDDVSDTPPQTPRTDLHISGVYPHLTTYGVYSQNGGHYKEGHNECGIGAIVPWAGKLWMVNYAPHKPRGSEHKLYSIDLDLTQPMNVHPESVGGTPAGRMIHEESKQLLIGHHLVDRNGNVRTIQPADMPIRVTAIARHLSDPKNMVYYIDMEGSIWEANVHTLQVKRLFKKPVPGWHGKGGYTSQGRLVISNNGELHVGDYNDVLVGGEAKTPEERGVLAEFDGTNWRIVERRQFTEVTGPKGITGGSDGNDPIWTMGWDRRSVRLKVLDHGTWHTYLLPKAAYCNDAQHGWYTEWPRIREITDGRWMMDMHGMFFDFPKTFSSANSAGIRPIGSHLRYVPDFCDWNGKLVLATDETSIQGNPLAGQPQSNLWFGTYDDLKQWGPASGYGGPWIEDEVKADTPSDPFLIAGFDQRILHLAVGPITAVSESILRTTDRLPITDLPESLAHMPRVTVPRGNWREPADGFEFVLTKPATVYLAVDGRGQASLPSDWKPTELSLTWAKQVRDRIYVRDFPAGKVSVPGNADEHSKGAFGAPHLAFVDIQDDAADSLSSVGRASVEIPIKQDAEASATEDPVRVKLQVDRQGDNSWTDLETIELAGGESIAKVLPSDLDAEWLRLLTDRDCVATAILHQTTSRFVDGETPANKTLFAGLADVDEDALAGIVYPAKRNRNLRVITGDGRNFDFTKADFTFQSDKPDAKLAKLLHVEPEFSVDEASVILNHNGKRRRLPKGDAAYDQPFASGWPRASREVQSERHLANIHGTFYEVPLITNGAPPAWNLMRPVSSHSKQITDFCSWNGLLALCGVRADATTDGHVFRDDKQRVGLWFGAIDDLWKLGKPVGRGGPWLQTLVKPGVPSDAYLMKGYDQKTVSMAHGNAKPIRITLQIDLDGNDRWVDYQSFSVPAGETLRHQFPTAFSACWIRAVCDSETSATVQFDYR